MADNGFSRQSGPGPKGQELDQGVGTHLLSLLRPRPQQLLLRA